MTRFRVIRGGLDGPSRSEAAIDADGADPVLARRLRDLYAPPNEGYWDGLEATVLAAVRAGRAAPSAAAEWWQTLAAWARPGLAAAAVIIGVVGTVALQSHTLRANPMVGSLIEEPTSPLVPLTEEFARAYDVSGTDPESVRARLTAELLSDGVKRRFTVPLESEVRDAARREASTDSVQARREATFRYLIP